MKFARVIPVDGRRQICARDKVYLNGIIMCLYCGLHRMLTTFMRCFTHVLVCTE